MAGNSRLAAFLSPHVFAVRIVLEVIAWTAVAQSYPNDPTRPQYAQY